VPERAKILIVEDNPDDALVMERCLERLGHEVVFAESGSEGVQQAEKAHPDLIILDYRLGDMAGTEVLLKIREKQIHAPVIMASGMGSHFIVARAIALGAQEFVSKDDPAFAEKLSDTVRRLVADHVAIPGRPLPDRSTVQSRAQEVKRMIGTLLESSNLIASVGIVGPDGALISGALQDKTGAQDVTAVLAGTVQMMLTTVAGHLGYGKSQFIIATFQKGSIAMAPLPGNLTLFVTSPAESSQMERLRKEIESASLELGNVMGPQTKAKIVK
jgi:CheY-like chemotaxis protein